VRRILIRLLRLVASAAIVIGVSTGCYYLPHHIDRVTVALFLLLSVLGLAILWGMPEAVFAAIISSFCLDYLFLPPFGLILDSLPEWIAVLTLLAVAIVTSHLSTRARQKAQEAIAREREMERLYRFGQAILQSSDIEATIHQGLPQILEIFGGAGIAYHDLESGRIYRAGPKGDDISEQRLWQASTQGSSLTDASLGESIVPLRLGGATIGSLGLVGTAYSGKTLISIGQRLVVAIERARVIEKETAAESARKSQELKSVVLDALAHGVKTPLTTIRVAASALLSGSWEKSPAALELLNVVEEETTHLERFVNEALQMARIDAGLLNLEKGIYDVRSLIDSSLEDLGAAMENRPIEIHCPEDLPPAQFDFRILKLVLSELLTNAIKYSPPDSPLVIGTRLEDDAIVVSVMDSGVGIEEGERSHIFQRYYRGRDQMQISSGSGMGLALAKSIVEAHQGRIWFQSQPGSGTVFYFSLPVCREIVL
jgi:two-component system, OmpR family, sensor histidine kinase KdpD